MAKLTDKQAIFVDEYLVDFNAARAARAAGYKPENAKDIGCQNLAKLNIQDAIQKGMEEIRARVKVSQDDAIKHLEAVRKKCMAEEDTEVLIKTKEGHYFTQGRVFDANGAIKSIESLCLKLRLFNNPESEQGKPPEFIIKVTH